MSAGRHTAARQSASLSVMSLHEPAANPPSLLERAYQIARSGECAGLSDLRKRLRSEGYQQIEGHLSGLSLRRELAALVDASNPAGPAERGPRGRFRKAATAT